MKQGLFEAANRGTVFLDEIGETSQNMQTRLLRVLEEREVQRVGSMEKIPVDIRVVAATDRPLQDLVSAGEFVRTCFTGSTSSISMYLPFASEWPTCRSCLTTS